MDAYDFSLVCTLEWTTRSCDLKKDFWHSWHLKFLSLRWIRRLWTLSRCPEEKILLHWSHLQSLTFLLPRKWTESMCLLRDVFHANFMLQNLQDTLDLTSCIATCCLKSPMRVNTLEQSIHLKSVTFFFVFELCFLLSLFAADFLVARGVGRSRWTVLGMELSISMAITPSVPLLLLPSLILLASSSERMSMLEEVPSSPSTRKFSGTTMPPPGSISFSKQIRMSQSAAVVDFGGGKDFFTEGPFLVRFGSFFSPRPEHLWVWRSFTEEKFIPHSLQQNVPWLWWASMWVLSSHLSLKVSPQTLQYCRLVKVSLFLRRLISKEESFFTTYEKSLCNQARGREAVFLNLTCSLVYLCFDLRCFPRVSLDSNEAPHSFSTHANLLTSPSPWMFWTCLRSPEI